MLALVLAAMMSVAVFAGCSNDGKTSGDAKDNGSSATTAAAYKDGEYTAKLDKATYGWTEFIKVTVKDGKISAVDYDATNDKNELKSENQAYEDQMKAGNKDKSLPEIGPMEFFKQYEDALVAAQDVSKVEAVAGASHNLANLKALMTALEPNMKEGKTDEVIASVPEEKPADDASSAADASDAK